MADFLEKTLETIIFENQETIKERGFTEILEITERQFRLPSGKIIDLLSWDIQGDVLFVNVIELKKGCIDEAAFFQGLDYYCEFLGITLGCFADVKAELILVGNSLSYNVNRLKTLNIPVTPYLYKYNYDGITFTKANKTLSDYIPMFKENYIGDYKDPEYLEVCNRLRDKVYELEKEAAEHKDQQRNKIA